LWWGVGSVVACVWLAADVRLCDPQPFTVDITSAPEALREQLVAVADIAAAVGAAEPAAVAAALTALGLTLINATVVAPGDGGHVLVSALRGLGVGVEEAARCLGLSVDDVAYLAREGLLRVAGAEGGGERPVTLVKREDADAGRVRGLLVPVDALIEELTPLVEKAGLGGRDEARAAVEDRLHDAAVRTLAMRMADEGGPVPCVIAAAGRKVVEDVVMEHDLTR
jgi:hypothetical protein